MSSKKWLVVFLASVILITGAYAVFNIAVDPFGVFGDHFFDWYSYNFTNNPRAAKIAYLEEHKSEYDSYIIGCSSTSSYPTETLNKYFDAKFYNMIMYGSDMLDVEKTCIYIAENYTVKNIVLNIYISNGQFYGINDNSPTKSLHTKAGGESFLPFYMKYMFLTPQYSIAKIKAARTDSYLPQPFDVFNAQTGAYDKRARDAEAISDMQSYLKNYPVFTNYPKYSYRMNKSCETVESVKKIKALCDEKNINLTVVMAPVYVDYFKYYTKYDIENFYTSLSEVTDFWDFSMSKTISTDPRFFYDESHFRNSVGDMMIARMFEDKSVYIPEDFGFYTTKDNVSAHVGGYYNADGSLIYRARLSDDTENSSEIYGAETVAGVPVLMYHHLDEVGNSNTIITPQLFESHIKALAENGYTAVSFDEIISYVENGTDLPEKPILITFDDGYMSNYTYAFPILKKYNMKATIFVIGSTFGNRENYKDTDYPITPHFGYDEAREMISSGLISVQSHTFDMHQWAPYESSDMIRENILRLDNESEAQYVQAMNDDFSKISDLICSLSGKKPYVCAYPSGKSDTLSQSILISNGIKVTLSTDTGKNTFVRGLPQSLLNLKRYNISESVSLDELMAFLGE